MTTGRTFYLAASSTLALDSTRARTRELERLGYTWARARDGAPVDWTAHLDAGPERFRKLAEDDIDAARSATLFVLLAWPATLGGMVELGARIGFGRRAHVVVEDAIGAEPHFFFFAHPLVTVHESWGAFLEYAADLLGALEAPVPHERDGVRA